MHHSRPESSESGIDPNTVHLSAIRPASKPGARAPLCRSEFCRNGAACRPVFSRRLAVRLELGSWNSRQQAAWSGQQDDLQSGDQSPHSIRGRPVITPANRRSVLLGHVIISPFKSRTQPLFIGVQIRVGSRPGPGTPKLPSGAHAVRREPKTVRHWAPIALKSGLNGHRWGC